MEHSAILLTCIKQKSVLKTNFWSFFEWPLKTGFTVPSIYKSVQNWNMFLLHSVAKLSNLKLPLWLLLIMILMKLKFQGLATKC